MEQRPWGPGRRPAPPAGMGDVERLLAYEEIRQLASRYALAVTCADLDTVIELFVDDVRVTRETSGRAALRDMFASMMTERVSVLNIGTHVINLFGPDEAAGTVLCVAEMGDRDRWARQLIAYEDTYARRDGTWYFVRRNHELFYGVETTERPLDQPEAQWPRNQLGRGSLPQGWTSWRAFHDAEEV
jgi:ketosteroid isomerase-like protein